MLLAVATALAADGGVASLGAGVGASFLFGGNASGYAGGLAQRLSGELVLGTASALTLDLDHARHRLVDAGAYFPDAPEPADAMSGFRDYLALDLGARVGVRVGDPDAVHAIPSLRFGLAGVRTTTLLTVPAFGGAGVLRANTLWPALSLGGAVDVRLRRWISVVPHLKTQVLFVEDEHERDTKSVWGIEWRLQPALDVSFHF